MPSTLTSFERLRPGGGTGTVDGLSVFPDRDVRTFVVAGNSPTESISQLAIDFPDYNQHPSGYLVAVGTTIGDRIGSGTNVGYEVNVLYGPPFAALTGGGTPVDRSRPTFRATSTSSVPIVLEAPTFVALPLYLEDQDGTRTVKGVDWQQKSLKISLNAVRFTVELNLPANMWGPTQVAVASAQLNKVHSFYGRKWQFVDFQQSFGGFKADQHKVHYSWISETGVPESYFSEYNARQDLIGNGGYRIPGLLPFQRWNITWFLVTNGASPFPISGPGTIPASGIGPYLKPYVFFEDAFVDEPNGYSGLPGGPIQ